jgi:hypothetical protein
MASTRGLRYPLQVSNGNLAISEDLASVEDQIISVLETRRFERVMRSNYGFDPGIFDTLEPNAINARIYNAVLNQVPAANNVQVKGSLASGDDGLYRVEIKYTVQGVPQPPLRISLNI